ncbi:cytochrome C [Synechococcales cyanobacterium C]|uniref:Cytochrome C n=1 Tax=Petrachloros mirabilis ULC683 TaxID=2781853 RepID=A0A8K2A7J9_9CYAN|nr:cytochrome C [Petrachloros mirabilis]NCJ06160.1 cytochrome C [Petrachloros mirabilis ULC683]
MLFFRRFRRFRRRRPPIWGVLVLVVLWSGLLGWGLAQIQPAHSADQITQANRTLPVGDEMPANVDLGRDLYLESCATCHLAVPPEVLPTETWGILLSDSNHYGVTLSPLVNPERALIWRYIQTFSRSLNPDEQTPYRLERSRYFRILHPDVDFTEPIRMGSCVTCHPSASNFDFRTLSAEWQD